MQVEAALLTLGIRLFAVSAACPMEMRYGRPGIWEILVWADSCQAPGNGTFPLSCWMGGKYKVFPYFRFTLLSVPYWM
jgi:hypothetical protein